MAGEQVSGQGGSISLNGTAVARVKNWKINPKGESKDITHMGSGGNRYSRTVLKSSNGSFGLEAYPGDLVGSLMLATFCNSSETGSKTHVGSVTIMDINEDVPFDDIVKWQVTFESFGGFTVS